MNESQINNLTVDTITGRYKMALLTERERTIMQHHEDAIYQPTYTQRDKDDAIITKGCLAIFLCFTIGMALVFKGNVEGNFYTTFMGAALAFGGCFASIAWMALSLDKYNEQVWDGE